MLNTPIWIEAIDVYLEHRLTREYVGRLYYENDSFIFTYDEKYLYNGCIPLGPDLPLSKKQFTSSSLFPSFEDRLPSEENPAYEEYLKIAGVSRIGRKNPFILLCTLGHKGPSSFIFLPAIKHINSDEVMKFRKFLGLSIREFSDIFDFSPATINRIEKNKSTGKDALKRLEIYIEHPEVLFDEIRKNGYKINDQKREYIENLLILNLSKEEVEKARAPEDLDFFITYLDKVYRSLYIKNSHKHINKEVLKKLREEVFLISQYAIKKYYKKDIVIHPKIGNQPYDAVITTHDEQPLEILEATIALDGHQEHKIDLQIEKYGYAGAWYPPDVSGSKNKGYSIGEPSLHVFRGHEICHQELQLINKALENKIKKQYQNVTLLVGYSGFKIVFVDREKVLLDNFIKDFLNKNKINGINKIVFVDTTKINPLVEYPIGA